MVVHLDFATYHTQVILRPACHVLFVLCIEIRVVIGLMHNWIRSDAMIHRLKRVLTDGVIILLVVDRYRMGFPTAV